MHFFAHLLSDVHFVISLRQSLFFLRAENERENIKSNFNVQPAVKALIQPLKVSDDEE